MDAREAKTFEEGRRSFVVFLYFLQLEDVVREGTHHSLNFNGNRCSVELENRGASRIAPCLRLSRLDGHSRMLFVVVFGLPPLILASFSSAVRLSRHSLRGREPVSGSEDDCDEVSDWLPICLMLPMIASHLIAGVVGAMLQSSSTVSL